MFIHKMRVRLKDTDATGVLYFSEQFRFAMETLEEFLATRGLPWKELMVSGYFLPVVHAEADYFTPLRAGDDLEIQLTVEKKGTSSITLHYLLKDLAGQHEVGRIRMVHVVVDQHARKAVPIPEILKNIF